MDPSRPARWILLRWGHAIITRSVMATETRPPIASRENFFPKAQTKTGYPDMSKFAPVLALILCLCAGCSGEQPQSAPVRSNRIPKEALKELPKKQG
jgi:hypothetical protein